MTTHLHAADVRRRAGWLPEDQDDLELENDEDTTKLRSARARPGAEDGSTAARGEDGTINPPFP